jgi:hypothetical protein
VREVEVEDVWKTYGQGWVLQSINLTVERGEFLAVMGPNLVKRANAVTGIGVTLLVAGSAVSGIFTPYPFLPETLKTFSRLYPESSSMHVIKRILLPSEFNTLRYGFDPLESHYIAYAIMASIATLATGLIIHSAARIRRARTL